MLRSLNFRVSIRRVGEVTALEIWHPVNGEVSKNSISNISACSEGPPDTCLDVLYKGLYIDDEELRDYYQSSKSCLAPECVYICDKVVLEKHTIEHLSRWKEEGMVVDRTGSDDDSCSPGFKPAKPMLWYVKPGEPRPMSHVNPGDEFTTYHVEKWVNLERLEGTKRKPPWTVDPNCEDVVISCRPREVSPELLYRAEKLLLESSAAGMRLLTEENLAPEQLAQCQEKDGWIMTINGPKRLTGPPVVKPLFRYIDGKPVGKDPGPVPGSLKHSPGKKSEQAVGMTTGSGSRGCIEALLGARQER
jgi:hypothetical protein